jgi:hypothetical protein
VRGRGSRTVEDLAANLPPTHRLAVLWASVVYPYVIVLEALSHVFAEQRRMVQALVELGYDLAFELRPKASELGTPDDPFRILEREGGPLIARWYVEVDEHGTRPLVRLYGRDDFMAKLEEIAKLEAAAKHRDPGSIH